jgi:hypothetical protein
MDEAANRRPEVLTEDQAALLRIKAAAGRAKDLAALDQMREDMLPSSARKPWA